MDENNNEQEDANLTDEEEVESSDSTPVEPADWEARAKALEEKAIAQRERTRALKVELSKLKKTQEQKPAPKTGELDESQLNYLDLKGISEDEEIKIVQEVVVRTGKSIREALKDDYVQTKLANLRAQKAVQNATPSSTKRSGNQTNDLATALARYEQTGELPDDFDLKSQVINAKVDKENTNKPSWHK